VYKGTRRDPDADTGGRWFESLIFIKQSKRGKRMAMDRQKVKTSSESRAGRMVKQVSPENRQGSKPGGLAKRE
jgi:hypothetical protein